MQIRLAFQTCESHLACDTKASQDHHSRRFLLPRTAGCGPQWSRWSSYKTWTERSQADDTGSKSTRHRTRACANAILRIPQSSASGLSSTVASH